LLADSSTKGLEEPTGTTGLGHPLTLSAQYLPDIVEPALAVAGIVAAEKGVVLHAQVASDTPLVWGEEEALGEVVSNLVDNAIKYSPAGAQVWVQTGVSRVGNAVGPARHYQGLVVGDTGPGIPAGDLARLFERHYRGVQSKGDIPGTGLGLAIAQSLVNEMQGSIEVISPAAGTPWMPTFACEAGAGTVFIVWLLEVDRN
jgi:signal transduction histidine kinase